MRLGPVVIMVLLIPVLLLVLVLLNLESVWHRLVLLRRRRRLVRLPVGVRCRVNLVGRRLFRVMWKIVRRLVVMIYVGLSRPLGLRAWRRVVRLACRTRFRRVLLILVKRF